MNSSATSFALIWNLDKNPIKRGHPRVIMGSLANHKGESLQAAASNAKKRNTASVENRTQTRAHCVCYLLLNNELSHSLGRVSGVQPLSPRPAFDLTEGRDAAEEALSMLWRQKNTPPGASIRLITQEEQGKQQIHTHMYNTNTPSSSYTSQYLRILWKHISKAC